MRLSLRFVLPLLLILAAIAYAVTPMVEEFTRRWSVRDLDMRSTVIANAIEDPLDKELASGSRESVSAFLSHISQDERFYAVGYCASSTSKLLSTPHGPLHVAVRPAASATNPDAAPATRALHPPAAAAPIARRSMPRTGWRRRPSTRATSCAGSG